MQLGFLLWLKRLKSNSLLNRQLCFSTGVLVEDPWSLFLKDYYSHLSKICLEECKSITSLQVFDVMHGSVNSSSRTAKTIHGPALKLGFLSFGKLGNYILDLYTKSNHTEYAEKFFLHLSKRDGISWNSIMSMKSRQGLLNDVLRDFGLMWNSGVLGNQFSFAIALSACAKLVNLVLGKQVHCEVLKIGLEGDAYCEAALVDMYSKCAELFDAKRMLDSSVNPDTVSWTSMILGFARAGLTAEAISIFDDMQKAGNQPDHVALVTILNTFVSQARLDFASRLFSKIPNPHLVAWNIMISGNLKSGNEGEAIKIFRNMVSAGIEPSRRSLGSVLSAIATLGNYQYGLQVHSLAVKRGLVSNVYVGSSLLNMYAKCQQMEAARAIFDGLQEKNSVLWNALLGGYAQNGHPDQVLELFMHMRSCQFQPDEFTITSVLSACASLQDLDMGLQMHSSIMKNDLKDNLYVQNSLVDMYAKCSSLSDAMKIFVGMSIQDNISWNTIIVGHVQEEQEEQAFIMFQRMMSEGIAPDEVSLASILSAAANLQDLCKGMQIHCFLVKYGLEHSLYTGCSLVDMYSKSGMVEAAQAVFSLMPETSVVCVNTLISGLAQFSLLKAANVFKCMLADRLRPSEVTFASLLEACRHHSELYFGRQLHGFILKLGFPLDDEFLSLSLLGMYLRLNDQNNCDAARLFSELPLQNSTIIWTVMISGNAQNGYGNEALQWYHRMRSNGVLPDQATFASVLKACSIVASLESGQKIHCSAFRIGYDKDELTASALVDMYSKCGDMHSSAQIFREMLTKKDLISWNSMIVGYAKNGFAENALSTFNEMQQAKIRPDEVTFLGILSACSHAGLVPQGEELYNKMIHCYGIRPRADHYACMVDLYGRWGFLGEAEKFINSMDFEPDSKIWSTYLNACRLHGDEIRGQFAFEKLSRLEPQSSCSYVLLSHMHASLGNWDSVDSLRRKMAENGVEKFPGSSRISGYLTM